jgi:hypothetical protein
MGQGYPGEAHQKHSGRAINRPDFWGERVDILERRAVLLRAGDRAIRTS